MANILRTTFILRNTITRSSFVSTIQKRSVKLIPQRAVAGSDAFESFEEKNERIKRPLSPHITIYKFQLPAILSISHRITGIALVFYTLGFGVCIHYFGGSVENTIDTINAMGLSHSTIIAAKAMFLVPFSYHLFNGIRHLIWDTGAGLSMKSVYRSGYFVLISTVIGSIIMANI